MLRSEEQRGRFDLVVSDIDGCLQPESNEAMDLESLSRIAAWNREAAGRGDRPMITLCSGRPQPFAEAMCKLIANLSVPCVAENGVWIYHPGTNEYMLDPTVSESDLRSVAEASRWLRGEYGPTGVSQQPGKVASISLYHADPGVLKGMMPVIESRFAGEGWPLRVSMTWRYINCDLKHVSKATGTRRLLGLCGLEPARVAGIGDTMSDLMICENVGWFACPGNAVGGLKERADFVATEPEARGVLQILDELQRISGRR